MMTIWKWLNGKKTAIASVLGTVAMWAATKGWIDQNDFTMIATILTVWTGVGIVHKIKKGKK